MVRTKFTFTDFFYIKQVFRLYEMSITELYLQVLKVQFKMATASWENFGKKIKIS